MSSAVTESPDASSVSGGDALAPQVIWLTLRDEAIIRAEAERAYPNECCGILLGDDVGDQHRRDRNRGDRDGGDRDSRDRAGGDRAGGDRGRVVHELLSVTNSASDHDRHHRFSIDPAVLLSAERTARAKGLVVLGFYHSHPDHPARPSEFDLAHAWPFYSYLIVSVIAGKSADITSWQLDGEDTRKRPAATTPACPVFVAQQIRLRK